MAAALKIRVPLAAWVIDGRDPERLEPMEAVEAALAEPRLGALIETGSLGYDSDAYVELDGERVPWKAGLADPLYGEVTEVIDGPGAEICEDGLWP